MSNEIVKFEDRVKERVKAIVADLIPEDKWQEIVDNSIVQFEKVDLPKLVNAELAEFYKAKIQEEFQKPRWQQRWNGNENLASEMVEKLIIEAAPQVMARIIGNTIQDVLYQLKNARY